MEPDNLPLAEVVIGYVNPDIEDIIKSIFARGSFRRATSIEKFQIVEVAKRVLGNSAGWHRLYMAAPNQVIRDFIYDTMTYINSGQRGLSINTWFSLITNKPEKMGRPKPLPNVGMNYIGKWVRHPDGINDLIGTFILLFGTHLENDFVDYNGLNTNRLIN